MEASHRCVDCGKPSRGERCRKHANEFKMKLAALERKAEDRLLLSDKRPPMQIAAEEGLTRQAVYARLAEAKRREDIRRQIEADAGLSTA